MPHNTKLILTIFGLTAVCCRAPDSPPQPTLDSETHWMQYCDVDADCGSFQCLCNRCTVSCGDTVACSITDAPSVCMLAGSTRSQQVCSEAELSDIPVGICLPSCSEAQPSGQRT